MDLPRDLVRLIMSHADLSIDARLALGVPPKRLTSPPATVAGLDRVIRARVVDGMYSLVPLERRMEPYADGDAPEPVDVSVVMQIYYWTGETLDYQLEVVRSFLTRRDAYRVRYECYDLATGVRRDDVASA